MPRIASVTVMLIGAVVLLGWSFGITALTSLSPEWVPMRPITAMAFILAGLSLWLTSGSRGAGPRARLSAGACAGLVATIGALTLSEYVLRWDLGIDRWLFAAIQATDDAHPGQISFASALNFLMVGATIILLNIRSLQVGWLIRLFILLISMVAGLGLLRYIPGVAMVSSITFNGTMALPTTVGFLVLCVGIHRVFHNCARECAKPGMVAVSEGEPKRRRPRLWMDVAMVPLVAVALGLATVSLHHVERQLIQKEGESLAITASNIADDLDRILYERYGNIRIMAQAQVLKVSDRAAISKYLSTIKESYHYYDWLGMVDAQGRIVASTSPGILGEDQSQRDWFKAVRDRGGIHVREAVDSTDAGGMMGVGFTVPILGPRNVFLGALTTRISLPLIEQVIAETVRKLEKQKDFATVEYQLLNREGDLLIDSRLRQEGQANLKRLAQPSALLSGNGKNGYIEETHLRRNLPVVTGYASCKGYEDFAGIPCGILIQMDRSDVLAQIQATMIKLGMAGAIVLVPLMGFVFWSSERLKIKWAIVLKETAYALAAEAEAQASKEQFRSVTQSANDAIISTNSGGTILSWNKGARDIFGYEEEEVVGKPLTLLMPQRYRAAHCLGLERVSRTGERRVVGTTVELHGLRKDGSEFPLDLSLSEWKSRGETFYSSIIRDSTKRKQNEQALEFKNALLLAQQETAPDGILVVDEQGKIILFNNRFIEMWGIPEELIRTMTETLIDGPLLKYVEGKVTLSKDFLDRVLFLYAHPHEHSYEEIQLLDGKTFERYSSGLLGAGEKYYGRIWYFRDITSRKKMEEKLRDSESIFSTFMNNSPSLAWMKDESGRYLYINKAFEHFSGLSFEELKGKTDSAFLPDDIVQAVQAHDKTVLSLGRPLEMIENVPDQQGVQHNWLVTKFPLGDRSELVGGVAIEITERIRAQEELQRHETHFRSLIENVQDIVATLNEDGTITYESPSVERVLGYKPEEMVGHSALEFIHENDRPRVIEALKKLFGSPKTIEIQ